jgi:hypothetical protein
MLLRQGEGGGVKELTALSLTVSRALGRDLDLQTVDLWNTHLE